VQFLCDQTSPRGTAGPSQAASALSIRQRWSLSDEDIRPKALEIICSLIERVEVGPPEEERGPCKVTLIGGLASVLAFVSVHKGCATARTGQASRPGQDSRTGQSRKAKPPHAGCEQRF
jgi:hypothetical protein